MSNPPKKDQLTDWYQKIGCKAPKEDKNFKKTYIEPNSRILCLGQSGCGKTSFVMEYLSRCGSKFYDIYLFCGAGSDEPIYNFLQHKIPEMKVYEDIEEFPSIEDIENDGHEKLCIIDDFITLNKKQMKKIERWVIASRKKNFTLILMSQNLSSVPSLIRRNIQYFVIFQMNDLFVIKFFLKNYGFKLPIQTIINIYEYSIKEFKSFFLIDTIAKNPITRYRKNFLEFLNPADFS